MEHKVWKRMVPNGDRGHLKYLLDMQLENKGVSYVDGYKFKYRTDGCRMSGDMNTSSGNCMIMCILLGSYLDTLGVDYRFANNGDDCVIILESRHL